MVALLFLLAIALCVYFGRGHVVDDAYIVYRYAENLVAGNGVVFNVGERVEGYTSPLWLLLLAGAGAIGFNIVLASKFLGATFALSTLLLLANFWPAYRPKASFAWTLAPLILLTNGTFWLWAVFGLETSLFTFLVVAGLWSEYRSLNCNALRLRTGVIFALATLTRPEGIAYLLAILAFRGCRCFRSIMERRTLLAIGIYLTIVGTHLAWRLHYYGDVLPNTAYAKIGFSSAALRHGLGYVMCYWDNGVAGTLLQCDHPHR